jgi:hypothetical protein
MTPEAVVVQDGLVFAGFRQLKILRTVVEPITVDVVNLFVSFERPAELLGQDVPMLPNAHAINGDSPITFPVDIALAIRVLPSDRWIAIASPGRVVLQTIAVSSLALRAPPDDADFWLFHTEYPRSIVAERGGRWPRQ